MEMNSFARYILEFRRSLEKGVPLQALLKRFALIYLPIVVVLSIVLLTGIRLDEQKRMKKIEATEKSRIEDARALAVKDLSEIHTHLRIIANLPLLNRYLDSAHPAQRDELEKLFLVLAREVGFYDQVRYLDAGGQEVIRINYHDGKPAIVPSEQLQNKSGRYYFRDTIELKQGEMFVSPLDLNIENGRLEIPYKPMIRFGTPVFDRSGRKKGVILLNYLGAELLRPLREIMQSDDQHSGMLLNRDGYWLSGAKGEDEWGFMLGKKERTFGHDFPGVWPVISVAEQGALLTNQGLFVYTTVHPLLEKERSSTGSVLANAPSGHKLVAHEYYWKIVSFVPHAVLSGAAFYNQTGGRILLVFVTLLLALAAWTVAIVTLNRKRAEEELRESEERYRVLFEGGAHGILIVDSQTGRFLDANLSICRMLGYSKAELLQLGIVDIHPEDVLGQVMAKLDSQVRGGRTVSETIPCLRKDGTVFYAEIAGTSTNFHGQRCAVGFLMDITERRRLVEEIRQMAYHDSLTGLPNRTLFSDRLGIALYRSQRNQKSVAITMLDLDHFKDVNDTMGHDVGDLLLKAAARRLSAALRKGDTVARFGGDEFVLILPDLDVTEDAIQVAQKIVDSFRKPFLIDSHQLNVTTSIGIAVYPHDGTEEHSLLKNADLAMYQAKQIGRDRYQLYKEAF